MPLRKPSRLPRQLNRTPSAYVRNVAQKRYGDSTRTSRRRKEAMTRFVRRAGRFGSLVAKEFRLWMLIACGVVIVTTVCVLLFAPFFDVREIRVRRQDPRIDPQEIEETLSALFKQRLILVTRSQVAAMLHAEYPDLDRVEISKEYPSTLTVTVYLEPVVAEVNIADAEAAGTGSGTTMSGTGAHAYLTRHGYFVVSPIALTKTPLPSLTITDWNIRPQNRTQLLEPELLQSVFLARDTLRRDFGLQTPKIVLYLRAQEFHIRTNKTTLWFDLRSPLPVQFQRFREFLKASSLDQAKGYIDLRIADKIIYQ